MKDYQKNFLTLALEANALKFGEFTLKSGRKSPYFFNASALIEHGSLDKLGEILAAKVKDSNLEFDMIFGPAYKGIFLGSILATKLSKEKNTPICFNRKEVKDHGEGGSLIGALPKGNVLIIDDVISSGLAIREALDVKKTNRLITVEESWPFGSVGSEIANIVQRDAFDYLDSPVIKVNSADVPMPYALSLEKLYLPQVDDIINAAKKVSYIK